MILIYCVPKWIENAFAFDAVLFTVCNVESDAKTTITPALFGPK